MLTHDLRKTAIRGLVTALTVLLTGAAGLAVPGGARASLYLSPTPTVPYNGWLGCDRYNGQIIPIIAFDGANLFSDMTRPETQRIYVQTAVKSWTTGQWFFAPYVYGDATGFDNPIAPGWDHVQYWYDASGRLLPYGREFVWDINLPGEYQVAFRLKWDRSSSGAAASNGWTAWIWEPGTCTFSQ